MSLVIAIEGRQGSGKTTVMSVLGLYLHQLSDLELVSTYHLVGSRFVDSWSELKKIENSIILFDEMWKDMDSRDPKANKKSSHWVNQLRKHRNILVYNTQDFSQIDKRARNATDFWIFVTKGLDSNGNSAHKLQFAVPTRFDEFILGRRLVWTQTSLEGIYGLFNSYEFFDALKD